MLVAGKKIFYFHLQDALLCYLGYLSLPSSECTKIIWEVHYSWVTRHSSVDKTIWVLQKYFYWPKHREYVGKNIKSYTTYSISNPTIMKQSLYTPFPTPSQPWESISIDYLSSLHSTNHGNGCVFVVMEMFSNMDILVSCKKSITI